MGGKFFETLPVENIFILPSQMIDNFSGYRILDRKLFLSTECWRHLCMLIWSSVAVEMSKALYLWRNALWFSYRGYRISERSLGFFVFVTLTHLHLFLYLPLLVCCRAWSLSPPFSSFNFIYNKNMKDTWTYYFHSDMSLNEITSMKVFAW